MNEDIQKAIENLRRMRDEVGKRLMGYDYENQGAADKADFEKDINHAIAALEKQVPKKLNYDADGYDENGELIYDTAFCGNCEHEFEVFYDEHCKYCPDCGQALDWSDAE